jgi:hypothetical protein
MCGFTRNMYMEGLNFNNEYGSFFRTDITLNIWIFSYAAMSSDSIP